MLKWLNGWLRMGIVSDVLSVTDEILGLRDELGAEKAQVFIVTRTWATEKGVGGYTEQVSQMKPTPYIVDLSHKYQVLQGGAVRQGDLLLKTVSKETYKTEDIVSLRTSDKLTEKYYKINGSLYEVISVTDNYVYWNVQIRKTIKK